MFGKKKAEGDKDKKDDEVELTEAKASSEQASVGEMKRGDYRIHIYVEKAKEFGSMLSMIFYRFFKFLFKWEINSKF